MPSRAIRARMDFHPVGQGLYASGHLYEEPAITAQPFFTWVYDCGTISSKVLVHNATKLLQTALGGAEKPRLGLVVVSHFDKDHISGLVNLLMNFHVEVLLMPYLLPWQRAAVVFGNGGYVSKRDRAFILDPVGTIASMRGVTVDRLVWVPSDAQNGAFDGDFPDTPESFEEQRVLEIDDGDPSDDWQEWEVSRQLQSGLKVSILRPGGRLYIRGIWEFVPYHDANIAFSPDASFLADASRKLEWLLKAPQHAFKDDVLKRLKELYERRFVDSKQRNVISLFMYAGSLPTTSIAHCGCATPLAENYKSECVFPLSDMVNVIYTGDGYLDSQQRWSALQSHMGTRRMQEILVFQVMHHGADANWHAGLAKKIRPQLSIFSSDPSRGKRPHPHTMVARDFAPYRPVRVDRLYGLNLAGRFLLL